MNTSISLNRKQAAWLAVGASALAFAGWYFRTSLRARLGGAESSSEDLQQPSEALDEALEEGIAPGLAKSPAGVESPHYEVRQNFASSPES